MPCSTCGHTLSGIGYGMFHCPRCGTLVNCPADGSVIVPALVARVRQFGELLARGTDAAGVVHLGGGGQDWRRLGIAESINLPGSRSHE